MEVSMPSNNLKKTLKITANCRAFEEIKDQFWKHCDSWKLLLSLKKQFGESIKVISEKRLPKNMKQFIFKINGGPNLKIKTGEEKSTKAAMEAFCYYIMLHNRIKRLLCDECELNGTTECLEHFLTLEMSKTKKGQEKKELVDV